MYTPLRWKKEILVKYLKPDENAWQFERNGTKRLYEERQFLYSKF